MATQAQVADFVGRRIAVGRVQPGVNTYRYWGGWSAPDYGPQLPTAQQLANDLFTDAEFRGLQLGGFLTTPTGEFLEEAVATVVPRALSPEFDLIVSALKLASDLQRGHKLGTAVVAATGGSVLLGWLVSEIVRSAPS